MHESKFSNGGALHHLEVDKKHHPAAVAAAGLTTLDFPFVSDIVRSRILSTLIVGAEKCFTWRRLGGFS